MPNTKCQRSPSNSSATSGVSKVPKTGSGSTVTADADSPGAMDGDFRVIAKVGSARKAARNDPKPRMTFEQIIEDFMRSEAETTGASATANAASDAGAHRPDHTDNSDDEVDMDAGDSDEHEDHEDIYSETSSDGDGEFPWLEDICAAATCDVNDSSPTSSGKQDIGSCRAQLIRRGQMRHSFWQDLEEPSRETAQLAFSLFDRYGRLKPEYYEHDFRKGNGVWGKELDQGDILFFESIRVDREWRRRGIATAMVRAILDKTKEKVSEETGFFAVVNPGVLNSEHALSFWRSVGFRRIGASLWFAFTDKPDHPSRLLEPVQDWDKPEQTEEAVVSGDIKALLNKLFDLTVEDSHCVNLLLSTLPNDSRDQQWLSADKNGDTFLHLAAASSRPELVKMLLSKVPQLAAMRNKEGYTALEILHIQLDHPRTRRRVGDMVVVMSDHFLGFGLPSVKCLAALQKMDAADLSTLPAQVIEAVGSNMDDQVPNVLQSDVAKIRRPCDSSTAVPVAEFQHDMLSETTEFLDGMSWVDSHDFFLAHVPAPVRRNMTTNEGMRQGFANLCDHFAECLRRKRIPSEAEINALRQDRQEWPPVTQTFLGRGGSVAAVANMVFETAINTDEWAGDGHHRDIFDDKIDALPVCRNDHEFGFVGGMCGYKRPAQDGSRFIRRF